MVDKNQLLVTFVASVLFCVMQSQFTLADDNVAKCDIYSRRRFFLTGTRGGLETTSVLYGGSLICQWTITVPDEKRVKLTFTKFDVGLFSLNKGSGCLNYVEIIGGRDLGRYCGYTKPAPLYSTGSTMIVTFYSNDAYSIYGIKADFEAVDKDPVGMRVVGLCLKSNPTYKNENIQLQMPSGRIQSPNYPSFYPPSMACTWNITVSEGKRIKVSFESFKLAYSSITSDNIRQCRPDPTLDYLSVKDGMTKTSSSLGTHCNSLMPAPIYSSGRHMVVSFHAAASENPISSTGFRARFQEVEKDPVNMTIYGRCLPSNPDSVNKNLRINASVGRFESPNYPLLYPYPMKCIWKISVPVGKKVKLSFESFNVGDSLCLKDAIFAYVIVKKTNGESKYFCGETTPTASYSFGNTLEVVFNSGNINLLHTGFRARFQAVDHVPNDETPSFFEKPVGIFIIVGISFVIVVGTVAIIYMLRNFHRRKPQNSSAAALQPPAYVTNQPSVVFTEEVHDTVPLTDSYK